MARRGWAIWQSGWRPMRVDAPLPPCAPPKPRYRPEEAALYVLTLCAVTLMASLYEALPLERVLGVQFVVGWFALDLVWSPASQFVRFPALVDYGAFAVATAAGLAAWWWWGDEEAFLYLQGVLGVAVGLYWILTETPSARAWDRGCVRALLLYGTVTVLALAVTRVQPGVTFTAHPWYCAFVLNALATTPRTVRVADRVLHGWTWGVLLEALARDTLVFDKFFYD